MEVFAARFPVFDVQKNVYAYEVAYQGSFEDYYQTVKTQKSSNDLMAFISLADMLSSRKGLVDFTRDLLISQYPLLFDKDAVVACLPASTEVDSLILERCRQFKDQGYQLALNDFTEENLSSPLLEFADLVKVDFSSVSPEGRRKICDVCHNAYVAVLARNLQDETQFEQARQEGFNLFGGDFFRHPAIRPADNSMAPNKLIALQLLKDVNRPDLSPKDLTTLVQRDVGLTYQLLKLVNSVWFGLRHKVMSIQHALVLLGAREVQRWASMMAFNAVGSDKPSALLELALTRAKFAEQLAVLAGRSRHAPELFLLGMFSVIDAIMDKPMEEILAEVALADNIKLALLGQGSDYTLIYKTMLAYEHGLWVLFSDLTCELKIEASAIPELYRKALDWSQKAYSVVVTDREGAA